MTTHGLSPTAFRRLLKRATIVPLALLGLLALVFLIQIMYLLSVVHRVNHSDRVMSKGNALIKLLVDGETGVRGYLISGEEVFLAPYHAAEHHSDAAFHDLIQLVSDNPAQVARLQEIYSDHKDWRQYARQTVELRRYGDRPQAFARIADAKRRMDEMRQDVADFIQAENIQRDEHIGKADWTTWLIIGASLSLTLVLGGVLGGWTRRQLVQVVDDYRRALTQVEAQAESLRRSVLRLESLHEIDRAILAAESVPELIRAALQRIEPVVPGEAFVVMAGESGDPGQVLAHNAGQLPNADALLGARLLDSDFCNDLGTAKRSPMQDHLFELGYRSYVAVPLRADEKPRGLLMLAERRPDVFDAEPRQIAKEVARQLAIAIQQASLRRQLQQYAADLERRVEERTHSLQIALESVKQLQGLLPICAWCKKVRDDKNYWHEVEHYVADHTDARFTHGICPACMKAHVEILGQNGRPSAS